MLFLVVGLTSCAAFNLAGEFARIERCLLSLLGFTGVCSIAL